MLKLEIIETGKDGTTGHMTVSARIVDEDDPVHGVGAIETTGIESLELQTRYGGNVEAWLRAVGRDMARRHRSRVAGHVDLGKWKGQKLEIE